MVTYSTNWMGPLSMKWYSDRGLTRKESKVLKYGQVFYPKGYKAGDVWEYDEITTHYCAGRIDIRDDSKEGYDGWDEYGVSPMQAEDWNALGDWLWDLETEEKVPYDELIALFEKDYGEKIRWWKDES